MATAGLPPNTALLLRATERAHRARGSLREALRQDLGEIQRVIGRSMRAAVDLQVLGERTITLDCDVIQADGEDPHLPTPSAGP